MKLFSQALLFGLLLGANSGELSAADIRYDSDVKFYVRGGIKPGPLNKEDFWVTVTPRLIAQNNGMIVQLNAKDKTTGNVTTFAYASCGVGNLNPQPAGMPITYWGVSCNLGNSTDGPDTGMVRVPENAKISVSSSGYHSTEKGIIGATSRLRTLYVASRNQWKSCDQAKTELAGKPSGDTSRRVEVHAYVLPSNNEAGFITNRSICIALVPRGAAILNASVTGAVYAVSHNKETYLGTFAYIDGLSNTLTQKDDVAVFADSGPNKNPTAGADEWTHLKYNGKLIVKLSVKFSTPTNPLVFDQINQPVLAYPPKNLPQ